MKIIFNADDLGLSKGVNLGIIEAYENGVVRSATMMANMPAFDHAVLLCKASSGLKIGVHLTLTAGAALGGSYKTITDGAGNFLKQDALVESVKNFSIDLDEVESEFNLQINKILAAGLPITHFDGHHHVHSLPKVDDIVFALAKKYGVAVRGRDCTFDATFYGNGATKSQLETILSACKAGTEIMCHPAYLDYFLHNNSAYAIPRVKELAVLTDIKTKMLVKKYGHVLASFADL